MLVIRDNLLQAIKDGEAKVAAQLRAKKEMSMMAKAEEPTGKLKPEKYILVTGAEGLNVMT
jgi:hypothetical protein